ncbi:hypothetical protein BN85312970 [Paracholeplasma brassicae]|uniref:Uncharacterized protein n=1 Tax=Acholeplasma brassicae TaxID=61635 RepID=U4KS48_9MOLU|nr:hypothetical protein [Paracholeplasma brassicae]CCV66318.1 hypothetical protein BN85312970 [Paracholeplasma brassicae]
MKYKFEHVERLMVNTSNFDMEILIGKEQYLIIKDVEKNFYSVNFMESNKKEYTPVNVNAFSDVFKIKIFAGHTLKEMWNRVEILSFNNSDIAYFLN